MPLRVVVILSLAALASIQAHAQSFEKIEIDRIASMQNLRKAAAGLRNAYSNSCNFSGGVDCDAVAALDVELALLDIQYKFHLKAITIRESDSLARIKAVEQAASEALRSVYELIDAITKK
jgi:hypothetical protein